MNIPRQATSRLFFAMLPDSRARECASRVARDLRLDAPARAVPDENFHVTLAFLGEVAQSRVPLVQQIGAAQRTRQFSINFDAYEYWPKPAVIVAAAREIPDALTQLWTQLRYSLALQQWALDAEQPRPHVTLARKVSQPPVLQAMCAFDWNVSQFSLMRSDTSGAYSAYTVVATWPLLYDPVKTWKTL